MVRVLKQISIIIFLLAISTNVLLAQNTNAFARVQVSPREGLIRQPYKVTVKVYSSTWFATPLSFNNLRIENAFIIPFTRTQSGIDYINKKQYASLTFYYIVFPYKSGVMEIPSLNIDASIPPEGDYKGVPVTIKTKVQTIKVNKLKNESWMVAKNITIKESWNKNLDNIKVGDVAERTITMKAYGTLPSLLSPLKIEAPENTSIYPSDPKLEDKRTKDDVNGVRTETISYLFEKEGSVALPKTEVEWVNPINKKNYKRTLAERIINVKANPDLAMMESLKDSLMALSPNTTIETSNEEDVIDWKRISVIAIFISLLLWIFIKYTLKLYYYQKQIKKDYLESETYFFKLLIKAISTRNRNSFLKALYQWYDRANKKPNCPAINTVLTENQNSILLDLINNKDAQLSASEKVQAQKLCTQIRKQISAVHGNKKVRTGLNP